ncbi:putative integral membrane protein [Desulfitispora alkaliphila]|uniref:LapA family protein n=1 Tax=Desulfitispora alkaliphila TaxID=622674 RepID=UPI003D1F7CDB
MNKVQVYLVVALVLALGVAAFAVQNTAPVSIYFLLWHFKDISLVLVILGSAALGAFSVLMAGMIKQLKQVSKVKELQAENKRLKQELDEKSQVEEKSHDHTEGPETGEDLDHKSEEKEQ